MWIVWLLQIPLTFFTLLSTSPRWKNAKYESLPISSRQLEKADDDMLLRLLDVQTEGAVVCSISQVGTMGVAVRGGMHRKSTHAVGQSNAYTYMMVMKKLVNIVPQ